MASPESRVVILSSSLPRWPAPDAGTHYLQQLCDTLSPDHDLVVLAPDFDGNADVEAPAGSPIRIASVSIDHPGVRRLARSLYLAITKVDPTIAYLPFALGLRRQVWREALRSADVVDLQWPETLPLARYVRSRNPDATLIATHHDVLSQRYARWSRDAASAKSRLKWRWASWQAHRMEQRIGRWVDLHVVFSEKDAQLLREQGIRSVEVVDPPLALTMPALTPLDARAPVMLFVGFLSRPENDTAARWLVDEIWPRVAEQVPEARCVLAGSGASEALVRSVEAAPGVTLAGFVTDLGQAYAESRVCAVPLTLGAGTTFKTIEALIAGVPVVTTSIGAEGIGGEGTFACVTEDPATFAQALVKALLRPDQDRADGVRRWAGERYGQRAFAATISRLYAGGRS